MHNNLPVVIIGAGPVGLSAAAELILCGIEPCVVEQGSSVGTHVQAWGHVRMFSPWRYDISKAGRALLEQTDWVAPDLDMHPTGHDLTDQYLKPLAEVLTRRNALLLKTRVEAVTRNGLDKAKTANRLDRSFLVRVVDAAGHERDIEARAVIDASGTWSKPNPAGSQGVAARGERSHQQQIAYGMPDLHGSAGEHYAGRTVAVLGSGHSALGTLLDLVALKRGNPETLIIWLSRKDNLARAYGGGSRDALAERGALGTRLSEAVAKGDIEAIHPFSLVRISGSAETDLILEGETRSVSCHELIVATGFRPDLDMLRELRLDLDPALECPAALAPLIDPNVHSCGTVRPHGARELAHPDRGFYIVGMKSYGRAPTFLLATGYEQVRSIVAEIAGDHEAAARVELDLPETGVCSTDFAPTIVTKPQSLCCGGAPKVDTSACCVTDEVAKIEGKTGCGCGPKAPQAVAVETASAGSCCA
jgi:thioredoxin reductase